MRSLIRPANVLDFLSPYSVEALDFLLGSNYVVYVAHSDDNGAGEATPAHGTVQTIVFLNDAWSAVVGRKYSMYAFVDSRCEMALKTSSSASA